jgi:hypothetical protein
MFATQAARHIHHRRVYLCGRTPFPQNKGRSQSTIKGTKENCLMLKKSYAVALIAALLVIAPAVLAATLKFEVDAAHSHVGFSIPTWGGLSKVGGKFNDFAVTINYDEADVTKSSVTAVIKAASIDTGIERRDAHLRNADFFDVEKYPEDCAAVHHR